MKSYEEIQTTINQLGSAAKISSNMLTVRRGPSGDGSPYLALSGGLYNYIVEERGVELFRKSTGNFEEFLYWFFSDICSELGYRFELENRGSNEYSRAIAFEKKSQLLEVIRKEWGETSRLENNRLLEKE